MSAAASIVAAAIIGAGGLALSVPVPQASPEIRSFGVSAGDTLVIRNDYGSVRILAGDGPQLEARIEKGGSGAGRIEVAAEQRRDKIFIYSFFQEGEPGWVSLDIQAPAQTNVVIWGANPEVELSGLDGHLRVQTLTGSISAQDITASASLTSEQGNIWLRSRRQPTGDLRLESTLGNILCEISETLNLHAWTRAGGLLRWQPGFELSGSHHEQQVGTGGPLLFASSLHGDVRMQFLAVTGAENAQSAQSPVITGSDSQRVPAGAERSPRPDAAPAPMAGSEPAPAPEAEISPAAGGAVSIKVNVDWVYLNVSVRDRITNRSIPQLEPDDFLVYEDNRLQSIRQFESAEAPFNLLLLLDISGSTKPYIDLIKDASIEFTRQIKSNDRIAVATFNSRSRLIQRFTNDRQEVAEAIGRIRSGGGTAFYDALDRCLEDYLQGMEGRTAIVVFSDGVDNQLSGNRSDGSSMEFEELYREVQEADPIVYTIFLDTEEKGAITSRGPGAPTVGKIIIDILGGGRFPPSGRRPPTSPSGSDHEAYQIAREQMQLIADQTGGRMYAPRRIDDLSNVYAEIADDLRIQYRLGYNSGNRTPEGGWHSISVKVKDRQDALVRTRRGYHSRPDPRQARP